MSLNNESNNRKTSPEKMPQLRDSPKMCLESSTKSNAHLNYDSSESEWETPFGKMDTHIPVVPSLREPRENRYTEEQKENISRLKAELKLMRKRTIDLGQKQKYKVNTKFVSNPSKKIEGDTPLRPFSKELLWYNPKISGTASEVFDMIFSNRSSVTETPWTEGNFSASAEYCNDHTQKHQEILQSYSGVSVEECSRLKQLNVLVTLQELLWMMHYQRIDANLEKTFRLMIEKFYCRFDQSGRLRLITKNDFSLIWNKSILSENSSIMGQREAGWRLRPVFIDGLAFLNIFIPFKKYSLPILPTKIFLELITHFILDGHKTVVYLPTYYNRGEHVYDTNVFNYLRDMDLIQFVDGRSRKAIEKETLKCAENSFGIVVSPSETLSTIQSIQCFPVVHRYSSKTDEFVLATLFGNSDTLKTRFDEEVDGRTRKLFWKVMGVPDYKPDTKDRSEDIEIKSTETSYCDPSSSRSGIGPPKASKITDNLNDSEIDGYETSSSETSSDSSFHEKPQNKESYQDFEKNCRLYSYSEKLQLDTSSHQLTLEHQVQLLSSFVHFTVFRFQRYRQIQMFFLLISRHAPELLPEFMRKSQVDVVKTAIENVRNEENNPYFPMYSISKL